MAFYELGYEPENIEELLPPNFMEAWEYVQANLSKPYKGNYPFRFGRHLWSNLDKEYILPLDACAQQDTYYLPDKRFVRDIMKAWEERPDELKSTT